MDFENPNNLKNNILSSIQDIEFFKKSDNLSVHTQNISTIDSKLEKLMEIITNRSNMSTESFLSRVKSVLANS